MKNTIMSWTMAAALGVAACGPTSPEGETSERDPQTDAEVCAQATAHVANCFPTEQVEAPEGCDVAQARDTIASDCDTLGASAGKGDIACNPFLWWTCLGSGGGSSDGVTITASIDVCFDDFCDATTGGAQCARATLEDASGQVVATDFASSFSSVAFKDLEIEDGVYTLRLWRRDGEPAQMIGSKIIGEPAEFVDAVRAIEVSGGEVDGRRPRFDVLREEAELMRNCADLDARFSSTCDGEPMEKEAIEWGWFVRVEGQTADGEFVSTTRPFFLFDAMTHVFGFRNLMAGEYLLTFIEMDVPGFDRENNPDYERLVDRWATGREIVDSITITDADVEAGDVFIGEFEQDHTTDCD